MRLAATVMLLRPALREGFEVLLLRRASASAFAPNAYVFPGGAVDEWDAPEHMRGHLLGSEDEKIDHMYRARSSDLLPSPCDPPTRDEARSLLAAAARELFEEAGVLIVRTHDGALQHLGPTEARVARIRDEVRSNRRTFASALEELGLVIDGNEFALFSHWVTPVGEARRFNAFFFAARTLRGQDAASDDSETHNARWMTPRAALDAYAQRRLNLVFPTIKHLERLAAFDDLDAFMVHAMHKPIITIAPDRTPAEGFTLPEELENVW